MSLRAVLPRASLRAVVASTSVTPSVVLTGLRLLRQPTATRSFSLSVARRDDEYRGPAQRQSTAAGPQRKLFIGNLPWSITPEELGMTFRQFGEIVDVRIPTNQLGQTRGFAHVQFANVEDAAAAVDRAAIEPMFFAGRHARVEFAAREEEIPINVGPTNNLLLYGFHGDEAAVQEIFAPHIRFINRIHVVRDRETNATKGVAFVEFYETDYATKALEELGETQTYNGQLIKLRYASPRSPTQIAAGRGQGRQQQQQQQQRNNYSEY